MGTACTLVLDGSIACGDGFVDEAAGEECDPGDPDSYTNACVGTNRPNGVGACDPIDCSIINDIPQCAVCGDGIVDEALGEQCDGDELNGRTCPGGVGTLQCNTACQFDTTECKNCGNGVLDEGEECDPNLGDLIDVKPSCADLDSPVPSQPYTSGEPGNCRDDCRWERTGCGYCGNGQVDRDPPQDIDSTPIPEWCDGNAFDVEALNTELSGTACTQANSNLRPIVECADNCRGFIPVDRAQPCCVKTGAVCPEEGSLVRCCFEVDNPDSPLPACQPVFDTNGALIEACR